MVKRPLKILLASALALSAQLQAEIALAPIFSDNMILQREVIIPLRGTADVEKQVTVRFNDRKYEAPVTENRWKVDLPPMPAGILISQ